MSEQDAPLPGSCGSCGRDNRPDARFCAGCGAALAVTCGSCQRELLADASFCDGCGAPARPDIGSGPAPPPAPAPAPANEALPDGEASHAPVTFSTADPEPAYFDRTGNLSAQERRAVEVAAVIGVEFSIEAVAAAARDVGRLELEATFDALRQKEVVEPGEVGWRGEPTVRFRDPQLRDAAYESIPPTARAELHANVGAWAERTAPADGDRDAEIAAHFEAAFHLRREGQADDADTAALGARAGRLLQEAAQGALRRGDLEAAASLAGRALDCLDDPSIDTNIDTNQGIPDLLLLACDALLEAGNLADGAPLVERLADLGGDDPRLGAWVDLFRAQVVALAEPDRLVGAEQLADAAAIRLSKLGDQTGVATARLQRANLLARLGRIGEGAHDLDLALAAARAVDDDRRTLAVCRAVPVAALWGPSPVPKADDRCAEVADLLEGTGESPAAEAVVARCQAVLEVLRGRHEAARALLVGARTGAEESGLADELAALELHAGHVELFAEQPAEAEAHLRRARAGLGPSDVGADVGQATALLARSLLRQGRVDDAEELAVEARGLEGENLHTAILSRSVRAEVISRRGDHSRAVALAREAVEIAEGTELLVAHADAADSLARVLVAAGDRTGAESAAEVANALFKQKGATRRLELGHAVVVPAASGPPTG